VFCVFFHIECVDKLAHHVGVGKIHGRSKSDLAVEVKSNRASVPFRGNCVSPLGS
jgi:hypothetical protein